MIIIEIAVYALLVVAAASNPEDGHIIGAKLGGRTFALILGVSVGWNWLRLVWTSYEKTESETDAPEGLGQAVGKWKEKLSSKLSKNSSESKRLLGSDNPNKQKPKPYEYPAPLAAKEQLPAAKTNKTKPAEEETIYNLERYKEMHEKGLISEDEYGRLKRKELGI